MNIRHSTTTCLAGLLTQAIVMFTAPLAVAGNLTVILDVGEYQINEVSEGWHSIDMDDFGRLLSPGRPSLQSRTFLIALPPGAEVSAVTTQVTSTVAQAGEYNIVWAADEERLSAMIKVKGDLVRQSFFIVFVL